jgi:valyl-tRNA synthetase
MASEEGLASLIGNLNVEGAPPAPTDAQQVDGEKNLSKNQLKKLLRGEKEGKLKKEKDPNRWAPKKENKKKEKKPSPTEAPFVNKTPKGEKKDMSEPMAAGKL